MGIIIGSVGPHLEVEVLEEKDINRLVIVGCKICGTYANAIDKEQAVKDLSRTSCSPDCENCNSLRHSVDTRPAVPLNGSCNDKHHVCPNDGNRWWQYNTYFHLWKQVTDLEE